MRAPASPDTPTTPWPTPPDRHRLIGDQVVDIELMSHVRVLEIAEHRESGHLVLVNRHAHLAAGCEYGEHLAPVVA